MNYLTLANEAVNAGFTVSKQTGIYKDCDQYTKECRVVWAVKGGYQTVDYIKPKGSLVGNFKNHLIIADFTAALQRPINNNDTFKEV